MHEELPEVLLYVVDAGGGHRATANALVAAAAEARSPFRFTVVNITDVLAPLDLGRRFFGASMEDTYNEMVRRQQTRFLVPLLRTFQRTIRFLRKRLVALVAEDLRRRRPVLVLSLFPNFNQVFAEAVKREFPHVPFRVLLTDFADFPPHFWMEPGTEGVIVATQEAADQAGALGLRADQITRTSGMVLHPRYYPRASGERRAELRREFGMADDEPALLLLFGGKGSPEMRPLAEALLREVPQARVTAVCGDNPALYARMTTLAAGSGGKLKPLGFTDRVADLLAASDLVLTKPGPGSIAEALHQRIPMIVCCNANTIPQERFNTRFVESEGVGVSVPGWREMSAAATRLLKDPQQLARMRAALAAQPENRAVFEVLDLVARETSAAAAEHPVLAARAL